MMRREGAGFAGNGISPSQLGEMNCRNGFLGVICLNFGATDHLAW